MNLHSAGPRLRTEHLAGIFAAACLGTLVAVFVAPASGQEPDPGEEMTVRTIEYVGRGRITYRLFCRSCHGESATGDGSVAPVLKVPPADLTRIAARRGGEFPFDEVFQIIDGRKDVRGHGSKEMPVWGDAFQKTEETDDETVIAGKITQLVYYLRSIQQD